MAGPLPKPADQRRRTNDDTIPTTELSVKGRRGRPPKCPYDLGKSGLEFWSWAWGTPQALAWDKGSLYALGRRAALEDDLAALGQVDNLDAFELLDDEGGQAVKALIRRLAALATGRLAILKEMRELDERFGLTSKSLAAMRWKIVAPPAKVEDEVKRARDRRGVLAVDPDAVARA